MEKRKENLSRTKMCRFCLTQTTPLKTLFERNRTNKECMSLKFKILSCLSYEVFPSDKMPSYICERCKFFMNTFYEFKKICRQSDEFVLKYVRNGTPFEPLSWPKALLKVYDSAKDIVKTVVEGGTTVQVSSQDTSESEDEDANIYNIQIGDDEEAKTTQIKVVTTNNDLDDSKTSKKDEIVETAEAVRAGENCWPCDECHRTYPLEQLLTLHKVRHHNRPKTMECDLCDAKFFTKADLTVHQLRHSDETPFQCVACDVKFKRLILLKRHERLVHSDLPQHNCPSCPASFLSVEDLKIHQLRHSRRDERNYVCDICDKSFSVKSTLHRHKILHNRELDFSCEYCPERFGSIQKLSRHLRSHAGERPYPCKFCDKSFIKSQHYTRHLRVKHRDEVRGTYTSSQADGDGDGEADAYPCDQCEETFGTQDELIFHSAIHATQNLTCPLCQEKFDNVDDVTAHIKSHVNGVEFMCDFCELVFTTKEKYENHLILAHEEEIQNEMAEGDSSMDAEGEDDEDVTGIQVKQDGDEMVIEMKKSEADNFMMSQNSQAEYEMKLDNTNSEGSEFDAAYLEPTRDGSPITTPIEEESATIEMIPTSIVPTTEPKQTTVLAKPVTVLSPQTTIMPAQVTVLSNQILPASPTVMITKAKIVKPPTMTKDNDNQTDVVIRKGGEIRRKIQQPADIQAAKKEKAVRVESSNSAGFSDKSLRLLEKELQDLKRTNSRSEIGKATSAKTADISKIRRPQVITSTPKLRSTGDEKKLVYNKSPALERKFERRITKENKEPSLKEGRNNDNNKEEEKKEKESKDSVKSVIKNGASDEGVRRSTRPSRVRDYAKMARDRSKDNSDDDDTDTEDDEEYKDVNISETRSKRRVSIKIKSPIVTAPASTNPAVTPTPRKRGRPRKDANKEVPEKIRKDESASSESTSQQDSEEMSNIVKKSEKSNISAPTTPIREETMESDQKSPSNDVILSPSGQALKKVPIKALPPGVKPMPLLMNARSMGQGELCEMQIGKKVVKVQKIVMTKADVEEMAKKGLVEMKDGTMVLKQGIKLPTSSNTLNRDIKETPKKEKAAPTRCDIGND